VAGTGDVDGPTFSGFTSLTEINASSVTIVGNFAFADCTALETVSLPKATSIGEDAFYYCTNLTTVELLNATSIGKSTFDLCTSLTTLKIPKVTSIGDSAFSGTGNITLSLYLGSTAPTLGTELFSGVTSSKTVNVFVPANTPPSGTGYGTIPRPLGVENDGWLHGLAGSGWLSATGPNGAGTKNDNINASIAKNP